MKYFIFTIFLFSVSIAEAQDWLSARSQSMGGVSSFLNGNDAVFGNPAGIADSEKWFGSAVFERRFLLADLDFAGAGAGFSTASGNFGFTVEQFGFEEFKNQEFSLSYGRKLSSKLSIGGKANYHRIQINEYGAQSAIGYELGLQAKLSKELLVGTHLLNPIPSEKVDGEDFAPIFRGGAVYLPSENLMVGFELEKDVDFPMVIRAGVEYGIAPVLDLRMGFSSDPGQLHFGFGLKITESFLIDSAIRYHQTLGLTPTLGLSFSPTD